MICYSSNVLLFLKQNMSYSWIIIASCILLCGHSTLTMECRTHEFQSCWVLISWAYKTECWKSWYGEFVFGEKIHLPKTCCDIRCSLCAHCPNGCHVLHQSAPFSCTKCCPHCAKLTLLSIRKCSGSSYEEYKVCKLGSCILEPTMESYLEWVLQVVGDKHVPHSNFDCPPGIRAHSNNLTGKIIEFGIIGVLVMMAFVQIVFLIVIERKLASFGMSQRDVSVSPPQSLSSSRTMYARTTGASEVGVEIVRGELSTDIHNDYTGLNIYPGQLNPNIELSNTLIRETVEGMHVEERGQGVVHVMQNLK